MENAIGMWTAFYLPAFLCGCAAGGAAMLALARKIIAKQAKQIALAKSAGFGGGTTVAAGTTMVDVRGAVAFGAQSPKRAVLHRVS